jgi:hypothetical protein
MCSICNKYIDCEYKDPFYYYVQCKNKDPIYDYKDKEYKNIYDSKKCKCNKIINILLEKIPEKGIIINILKMKLSLEYEMKKIDYMLCHYCYSPFFYKYKNILDEEIIFKYKDKIDWRFFFFYNEQPLYKNKKINIEFITKYINLGYIKGDHWSYGLDAFFKTHSNNLPESFLKYMTSNISFCNDVWDSFLKYNCNRISNKFLVECCKKRFQNQII